MSDDFYGSQGLGSSPFDDFLARIYGSAGGPVRPGQRIDITQLMSGPARELLAAAAAQAAQWGDADLDTNHLLWAAATLEPTRTLLERAGADPDALARGIAAGRDQAAKPCRAAAAHAGSQAGAAGRAPDLALSRVQLHRARAHSLRARGEPRVGGRPDPGDGAAHARGPAGRPGRPGRRRPPGPGGRSETPTLDEFGRDLTAMAREGRIDPVIGRDSEIEQTIEVLSRRGKNNPVLIGEAGVGKTAIVEGLAQHIVNDEVPQTLAGKRVVQLELSGVVAGTRYRGDFEQRLKKHHRRDQGAQRRADRLHRRTAHAGRCRGRC